MGFFDWLFGRKNKAQQVSTAAPATETPPPAAPADDEADDDWAEATTFISRRLPPSAQREIKNLRSLLAAGTQHYNWVAEGGQCEPCKNGCRKFVTEGPYAVGAGLSGQAPVPGRESPSGDCQCTVVAADSP